MRSHLTPLQAPINSPIVARAPAGCPSTISGGAIAGIVLGSIAGTLLVLWLWRVCQLPGAWSGGGEPDVGYRPPIARSSRGRRRRRSRGAYADYVEKPPSVSRRYRDDVRRPQKVYIAE
ncbi:uncharacterized protein N7498_007127 [Penicillium cinerascens]|uniref:Uncharacterized protein n=1 Tax=Penicillium cinerascens TaxID=70096 RepID=A0A9W9MD28_9EURO|nr:uncharacterized protein N7498_007127 [Penicillium cinerascens]KAJ5198010.1 hypothetical protein N7498_007127 [Penicillium cinerascens]